MTIDRDWQFTDKEEPAKKEPAKKDRTTVSLPRRRGRSFGAEIYFDILADGERHILAEAQELFGADVKLVVVQDYHVARSTAPGSRFFADMRVEEVLEPEEAKQDS